MHKYHTMVLSAFTTRSRKTAAALCVSVTIEGCVRGKRKLRDEVKSLRHGAELQNTHHGRKAEQEHWSLKMRKWKEGREVNAEKEDTELPVDTEGKKLTKYSNLNIMLKKKWGIEVGKWLFKILSWISKSHTCIFSWQTRALCGFTNLGSCDLRLFELIVSLYYQAFSVQKLTFDVVRLRATIVSIYYYVCHNGTW